MSRRTETVLAIVATVLALAVICLAVFAGHLAMSGALREPTSPWLHIPCNLQHPHCDLPNDGKWVAP